MLKGTSALRNSGQHDRPIAQERRRGVLESLTVLLHRGTDHLHVPPELVSAKLQSLPVLPHRRENDLAITSETGIKAEIGTRARDSAEGEPTPRSSERRPVEPPAGQPVATGARCVHGRAPAARAGGGG